MTDYKFETAKEALEDDGLVMDGVDGSTWTSRAERIVAFSAILAYRDAIFEAMEWGEFTNEVREEDCE